MKIEILYLDPKTLTVKNECLTRINYNFLQNPNKINVQNIFNQRQICRSVITYI